MVWRADASKGVIVYGLRSSEDRDLRYIGQTVQALEKRLDSHIHCPKPARNRHLYNWIKSVRAAGFNIEIVPLYENAVWSETEMDLIRVHREIGVRLVNGTDGGDGCHKRVWTTEQRKAASDRRMGMKFSESHRESMRRQMLGKKMTPEARAKQKASLKGRMPKNIDILHAALRGRPKSAAHRAAISATLKGRPRGW